MKQLIFTLIGLIFSIGSFAISPISGTTSICAGNTSSLTDSSSGGTWSSSNTAVATIGSTGVVTGVASGTTTISYTLSGTTVTAVVTVSHISAISGYSSACSGSTFYLTDSVSGGTWSSSSTGIATIGSSSGFVTAVSAGSTVIYYLLGGCYASHAMTINPAPAPISGSSTVCTGSTTTLTDATSGGTWSSNNTAIASVSSAGIVTGVSSGAATISYIIGSCYSVMSVTVNPGPSAISGTFTSCAGSTFTLTDLVGGGTWSSSSTAVATIGSTTGVVTAVAAGTANIYYVVGSCYISHTVTITASPATISGSSTVCTGSTTTLTDATSGGTWSSSNTAVATVGSSGVVSGVSSGAATISYIIGSCYAVMSVTVNPGPSAISGTFTSCAGSTFTLTDLVGGGTWSSSSTAVATIGSTTGVVTAVAAGTANIYYVIGSCYISHTVTITASPATISGYSTVCTGSTTTLTDGTSGGTWASSNTAVASVGSSTGVVTGVSAGAATISYIIGSCYAVHSVTVSAGPSSISGYSSSCAGSTFTLTDSVGGGSWTSSSTAIATVGSSTGVVTGVSAGTANIYYSIGSCTVYHYVTITASPATISGYSTLCTSSPITLTDATSGGTWASSNTAVATVGSSGIVSGVSSGAATISYIIGSCYAVHSVTVSAGPSSISGYSSSCAGSTFTLTDSVSGGTWTSSSTAIATIGSTTGVVTGVSSGTVNIYYSIGSCTVYHYVTITASPATISGYSTVCTGNTITLTDATSGGTWSSANSGIANVGSSGIVTGVSSGVTTISYIIGSCYAVHSVTVGTGPSSISGYTTVCAGSTFTLTDSVSGGTWSSGSTGVATVGSLSGVVTTVAAGYTNIYYTVGGCTAYHTVSVVSAPAAISGYSTVCTGGTITLTDATGGGTWSSGNTAIASITSAGVVTGVSGGVTNITYSIGTCYAVHSVTVSAGASAISGPSTACVGGTFTLTDSTSGGSWSSSSTSIATIGSSTGVVTAIAAGYANIYYIIGSCGAYHTVTIMASPASISGYSSVCTGSSITLTDATAGGIWSSSSSGTASVSSASGIVTGVSTGVATVSYSIGSCYATHSVTVNPAPSSITGSSTICPGTTETLSDAVGGGTWTSGSTGVATVGSTTGVVTAVTGGLTNIYYSVGGCTAYFTLTVIAAPAPITGYSTVCTGSTLTLSDATTGGTWSSSNSSIASVNSAGIVTGDSAGVAAIYYIAGSGCGAIHTVTVIASPSAISGPSSVCVGQTITLTDATGGGTWYSGSPTIATIGSSTGIVTGVAGGLTTTITYYLGSTGCRSLLTVTVNSLASISGYSTVCQGYTTTLTDGVSGGVWSSSSTGTLTVGSSTGVVTGVSAGVATVYYSLGSGCVASYTETVVGFASITGPSSVCVGQTITLSESGSGSWYSSAPTVATVGSTGIVTGVAGGLTATITYYASTGCHATYVVSVIPFSAVVGYSMVCSGSTLTLTDATTGGTWTSGNTGIETVDSTTGVITGVSSGVTSISYTVNGCNTYHTMTVLAAPAAISGPSSVCAGHTITLTDATGGGTWSCPSTTIATVGASTGIVTGVAGTFTATVTYAISNGCRATDVITVYALPVVGAITGTSSVTIGGTTTFSDTTSGGVWTSTNTAIATVDSTTGVVTGTGTGTAYILYTVTNSEGCYAYYAKYITSGPTPPHGSGLEVNNIGATVADVKLAPNPNTGEFTLLGSFGTGNEEITMEITNMLGQVVYNGKLTADNGNISERISLGSSLSNGIYILNLRSESQSQVIRFVIAK